MTNTTATCELCIILTRKKGVCGANGRADVIIGTPRDLSPRKVPEDGPEMASRQESGQPRRGRDVQENLKRLRVRSLKAVFAAGCSPCRSGDCTADAQLDDWRGLCSDRKKNE